ncbi:hypothetical protein QL285_094304 [Trifolium repens]|nr:hypothetical protein QL285_094304 [Trifolium repens]
MWDPLAGKAAARSSACGGIWQREKHRRAARNILRRLATGKAPSGTPNYSAAVGDCLWVWLCMSLKLATGQAPLGSPNYSTKVVGGFWLWVRLAD